MKKLKSFGLLAILAVSVFIGCFSVNSVVADHNPTWWDYDWNQRLEYTVNSSLVDGDLTDFPVLIFINESVVDWGDIQNDLDDIRFTGDYLDELDFEIDSFVLNSEAWFWVRLPEVSSSDDTYFFMYYDNKFCGSGENAEAVWDSDFVMVQHMNDETTSTILDSTSNDNDGTKKAANEPIEADGQIGKAQDFDGADDKITISNSASLKGFTELTVTCWIKASAFTGTHRIVLFEGYDADPFGFNIHLGPDSDRVYSYLKNTLGAEVYDSHAFVADDYFQVGFVWDGANFNQIHNGVLGSAKALVGTVDPTADLILGVGEGWYGTKWFDSISDEIQISTIRSSAWVGASYYAQSLELVYEGYHTGVEYARRGEVVAAALIASVILIPLLIIGIFAAKRKW